MSTVEAIKDDIPDRPVSPTRTAKLLDKTRESVKRAIENGEIRTVIWAGRRFVPPSEIRRKREELAGRKLPPVNEATQ